MELELRIVRDPYPGLAKQRARVFGEAGGSVGRGPSSYWLLPDPNAYLSGCHCLVLFRDGDFWIRDTSRNGVFVNGSEEPLGFGHRVPLHDGDELKFAKYKVQVRFRGRTAVAVDQANAAAAPENRMQPTQLQAVPDTSMPPPAAAVAEETTGEHAVEEADTVSPTPVESVPAVVSEIVPVQVAAPRAAEDASQPAELVATRALDPALVASELQRVVHVDRAKLQASGQLPPASVERLIFNQFRHIKRPVIRNALGRGAEPVPHGHLVMVTSSLPGEGKTFSCVNLAFSMAREKDLDVVLIDADIAKQHVSRVFGVADEPGLLNALADDLIDVETLILPTDVRGLSILPAGQCAEDDIATELLASTRMDEVAARIGARSAHRIALFDSPPLLLTNEARVLASLMGQILLVVRAGVTPQQAVLEAISYVDEGKPLGLILNQSHGHAPGSYYGYGAYGYGAYGGDADPVQVNR